MISLGNLIGIPFWTGSGLVKLPTCISTTAVSWFKDLNSVVEEGSYSEINTTPVILSADLDRKMKMTSGNGIFVSTGIDLGMYISYSLDNCETWVDTSIISRGKITYVNNLFITSSGASYEYIAYSSNGINWTEVSPGVSLPDSMGAAYDGTVYMIVSGGNVIVTSDLSNFSIYNPSFLSTIEVDYSNLIYDGNYFVLICTNSSVSSYKTLDGITWIPSNDSIFFEIGSDRAIILDNNIIVSQYENSIYYSSNSGDDWSSLIIWPESVSRETSIITTNGIDLAVTQSNDSMGLIAGVPVRYYPNFIEEPSIYSEVDLITNGRNYGLCFNDNKLFWINNRVTYHTGQVYYVNLSSNTIINVIKDAIGERTDEVYYGQYLDATSGQINFYRTGGTFDYTDPSDGSLIEGVSIPGDGLYTIPANGICDIGVYPREGIYDGVLDFDGIDDNIILSTVPNVTGNKTISFKLKLNDTLPINQECIIFFYDIDNNLDNFSLWINNTQNKLVFQIANQSENNVGIDYSLLLGKIIDVEVIKSEGIIEQIKIDNEEQVLVLDAGTLGLPQSTGSIGSWGPYGLYFSGLIWDINIYDDPFGTNTLIFNSPGNPGDIDAGWDDTVGSITATVYGSPTTDRIITSETGGLEYYSFYPTCERAGTVLHDVMENTTHISVATPVWSESLYGSDYLNQYGYVNKEDNDAIETTVEGLLDFDGVDDYINFDSIPDITGDKIIKLKIYNKTLNSLGGRILSIRNGTSDMLEIFKNTDELVFVAKGLNGNGVDGVSTYDITKIGLLDIIITKTISKIVSIIINGKDVTSLEEGTAGVNYNEFIISGWDANILNDTLVWDLNINDEHAYTGYPNGNTDSAWLDTIGSIDGTVYGSPTTTSISIYDWETEVDGSPVTLDDDTLIPLRQE